jgi:isopenicillin N synthase-like dioxygenase
LLNTGCRAHTDIGGFTLLLQSSDTTALQVKNRQGEWIDAKPIEGTFVVNIGDTMQRWTNDQFVSTVHRVINIGGKERYSIAMFYGPNYFTNIDCIPTCHDDKICPKKYEPILAGEFITNRLYDQYQPKFLDTDIGRLPSHF